MSKDSDKVYQMLDKYINRMLEIGKRPGALHITKPQFKALEANFKKSQSGSLLAETEFVPSHRGIPIEVYKE